MSHAGPTPVAPVLCKGTSATWHHCARSLFATSHYPQVRGTGPANFHPFRIIHHGQGLYHRAGYLLLMAVPRARQTYTLTYDLNSGTMLLAGEPTVGRELIGSLATVNRPSRFHSLPRFSSNQFLSFRQCSPRGSRRFIWGTHLSESPSPPEPNLESRAHPDSHVARIVHRLTWRFVVSNRPAPWPTMGL
jgi:hypothetical protein